MQATVRLASADVALSSGRAEWGGLIEVLVIATNISAAIELRLDNLQVVNTFNDGEWRYMRNWLRRNDRDMAMLAWALNDARVRAGKGPLTVIHQLGHPEKRKTAAEYDSHERYNVKVDHLTHAIRDDMPVYVSFSREYSNRTSLWHEPLEEENVGLGALHEVTSDSYKHLTRSAQRRLSIARLKETDGVVIASHSKGAIGRVKSERRSPLITKIMHCQLATDARLELWAGRDEGSVTCACGRVLTWNDRTEVGSLQWHMLECTMPQEIAVRKRWYGAVDNVIATATDDAYVRDAIMACWSSDSNGWIHTAADDQDNRWRNPSIKDAGDGHWEFDATGSPPTFDAAAHWDCDTDDEVEDLTSDAETVPLTATSLGCVSTAAGQESFDRDWDGIEASSNPTHTAARLLHKARQMIDTSRWWTMRWPSNSISLLSRACDIDIEKAYKLFRSLRLTMLSHVRELWLTVMERRHVKDNTEQRNLVKEDWLRVKRLLARMVNAKGKAMPDWRVVRKQPIYSIRASLGRWKKVKRKRIAAGGQTAITGFFRSAPRAAPRAQHTHGGRPVTAHDDDDGATTAAATAADSATTTVVDSRKRQLTMEGFSKRKRVVSPTLTDPRQVGQEADAGTTSASTAAPPRQHPKPPIPPEPPPAGRKRSIQQRITFAPRQRMQPPRVLPQQHDDGTDGATSGTEEGATAITAANSTQPPTANHPDPPPPPQPPPQPTAGDVGTTPPAAGAQATTRGLRSNRRLLVNLSSSLWGASKILRGFLTHPKPK